MASVPPPAPSSGSNKSSRILACVLCQHRKIKCDRSFPCANCLKASVQCTPSTPAPPRKRRRPNQDLQERLARCEELLREYASEGKSEDSPPTPNHSSTSPQQTPKPSEEPMPSWHKHGKLIQEEGGTRFIDSYVVSTIYEELKAMRDIIDDDETTPEDDTSDSLTPDTNAADLLFGGETPQSPAGPVTTADLHPDPAQVFRLWQVFLDRVNPLFKVIHVQTLQPYLVDAASRSENPLPKNVEALLFSIYNMAVVALSEDESQAMLNCNRDTAIQRFSTGIRMCLNQMKFLKNHDLVSLQALVLYLVSLQGRFNRHAAWILNGVVVRVAQKMGLHRDGTWLGLSPFDTEMRRRIWWQIVAIDGKYAFMSGLGHALLPRVWDTQQPRNLNDADLHASAAELPPDRDGPTEMVFVLMQNRITRFLADTPGRDPSLMFDHENAQKESEGPNREQLEEYRSMAETLARDIADMMEKRCDPSAGPIHDFTVEFMAIIMAKIKTLIVPGDQSQNWGKTRTDHVFRMGVENLEHHVRHHGNALKNGFLWFTRLQFHKELFIFIAGQLCHRPAGPPSDKAWECVEALIPFHPEFLNVHSSKAHFTLGTYLVKAWKAREDNFMLQVGLPLPAPPFILRLREAIPNIKMESPATSRLELEGINNNNNNNNSKMGPPEPTFDEYLGNYLEAGDWDIFSNISIGPNTTPGMNNANGNTMAMGTSMNPSANQMQTGMNGLFGLGSVTDWKNGGY